MDSSQTIKNYENILQQKLESSNLNEMLSSINKTLNMQTNEILNADNNTLKTKINEQIVDKFITILTEVQKMKADHEEDEKFANLMADDIEFDIPPMDDGDNNNNIDIDKAFAAISPMTMDFDNENAEMLDEFQHLEQLEPSPYAHMQSVSVSVSPQPSPSHHPKPIEKELSPHDQLKALYAKEEKQKQNRQKLKLKLRIGDSVDIYSASKKLWFDGIIKDIKGDVLCVIYGKKMKWLKKDSKQLRPKLQSLQPAAAYSQ